MASKEIFCAVLFVFICLATTTSFANSNTTINMYEDQTIVFEGKNITVTEISCDNMAQVYDEYGGAKVTVSDGGGCEQAHLSAGYGDYGQQKKIYGLYIKVKGPIEAAKTADGKGVINVYLEFVGGNPTNNCNDPTYYTYCKDSDGDRYGNSTDTIRTTTYVAPTGYVKDCTDCNDNNNTLHPYAIEVCDAVDNDCNGCVDEKDACGSSTPSSERVVFENQRSIIGDKVVFIKNVCEDCYSGHGGAKFVVVDEKGCNFASVPSGAFSNCVSSFGSEKTIYDLKIKVKNAVEAAHTANGVGRITMSYEYIGNGVSLSTCDCPEYCVTCPNNFTIPLKFGWNLVSFPSVPEDDTAASVLHSIDGKYERVIRFNDTSKQYENYQPSPFPAPANDFNTIENWRGYWISVTEDCNLTTSSVIEPPPTTYNLKKGWNLIGLNFCKSKNISSVLAQINGKYNSVSTWLKTNNHQTDRFIYYFPSYPTLNEFTTFEGGKGYWIFMTQDAIFTLTN
ncbi:MAG: hypothetical protein CVU81_00605 [Euryarchaeota archaeon HGW-Euryarchaeota-1]|nr:MAG: hypothetical protein CVU81_00605 [Euryarchaeota archaeon HGW-Euryarchaeota-1]